MDSMGLMHNLIHGLTDIVYPKTCHVCKNKIGVSSIDEVICPACWAKIKINLPPFCQRCGRSLRGERFIKNACVGCISRPLHFDGAFSPCSYEGVLKELIHLFKYKNKDYLGATLSKLMINFIKEYNLPIESVDSIVPIPLSGRKLREREFNQALILCQYLSRSFNKDVLGDALLRHRDTKTQAELKDSERLINVKGAFSLKRRYAIKGKNVLLIDDVLTTGATSSEAALTLKQAGANTVYVLTLAN